MTLVKNSTSIIEENILKAWSNLFDLMTNYRENTDKKFVRAAVGQRSKVETRESGFKVFEPILRHFLVCKFSKPSSVIFTFSFRYTLLFQKPIHNELSIETRFQNGF